MGTDGRHLRKEQLADSSVQSGYGHDKYAAEKKLGIRDPRGQLGLKKLRPIHRTMIQLHCQGMSNDAIARELGKTPITVHRILSDPLSQSEINRATESARAQLDAAQIIAIQRTVDALHPEQNIGTNLAGVDRYIKLSEHLGIRESGGETAEDVVGRIMAQVNVQVNVNTGDGRDISSSVSKERVINEVGDE